MATTKTTTKVTTQATIATTMTTLMTITTTGKTRRAATITTTDRRPFRRRGPRCGVLVVVAAALAACSGPGGPAVTETTIGTSAVTTSTATTTSTVAATTSSIVDPAVVLADALQRYGDGYTFTSTAGVGGAIAITASGRQQGTSSEILFVSGAGEIEYLLTPEGQWARTPGGDWEELEAQQPPAAPLAQLAAPTRLEVTKNEAGTVELSATYDGAAFGLAPTDLVVQLTIRDGYLTEARYTSEENGVLAEVITQFAPAGDTTLITVPPAGA
jgi:hypothetical protein